MFTFTTETVNTLTILAVFVLGIGIGMSITAIRTYIARKAIAVLQRQMMNKIDNFVDHLDKTFSEGASYDNRDSYKIKD